jgi:hypothetical protein
VVSLRVRVGTWLEDINKEALDLLSDVNYTDPFVPGFAGGMTVNDPYGEGPINPSVHVRFYNLARRYISLFGWPTVPLASTLIKSPTK